MISTLATQITRGTIAACFFLPLAFFPGLISLYRLPKLALLAFFTCALCWLWLLTQIRKDSPPPIFPLFVPIVLYVLITAASLYRSINPVEGSSPLFLLILGITLFWITVNQIGMEKISTLFHWTVIAGGLVALLGIAQVWGAEIPTLIPTGGPGSTFGNKNMAAQFLLFVMPVAFYFLLSSSEPASEWFYASLAGLITTYFIYTGTRAAWGGAMVGLIVSWFCLRASGFKPGVILSLQKRKIAFLTGIAAFVLATNLLPPYFIPGWNIAGLPSPLARLGSMIELEQDSSAQTRFAIWANSLAILYDHPFLGVGKGNFRFFYPLYARRVIEDLSFSAESRAADAHNDYVQLLAETGVSGAFAFLLILILLARRLWKGLRENFNPQLLPIIFALIAILAEAFWDFPFNLPVPTAFFWIYAGLLWRLTETDSPEQAQKPWKLILWTPIAVLTLLSTPFSIFTISSLRGEFYYSRGARAFHMEDLTEAERNLTQAIKISLFNHQYHFLHGLLMLRLEDYPKAIGSTLRSLTLNPYNINALNNLGVAYASAGNIPKAIQAFQTSIRIWPNHKEAHSNLGTIYVNLGDKKRAIQHFQAVLRISPKDPKALGALRFLNPSGEKP